MSNRFSFDLATILRLAEHACASTAHVDADDGPATTPALLFVADRWGGDGIHIASNGRPSPPDPNNDRGHNLVAEPDGLHETHWMDWMDTHPHQKYLVHDIALTQGPHRLLDLLRAAHAAGFDTFLLDVTDGITTAVAHRRNR